MRAVPPPVGESWHPLCEELQEALGRLDPPAELLEVGIDASGLPKFQVKLDQRTRERGHEILREFESRALELCAVCGGPSRTRTGAMLTFRCDHCT